MSIAIPSLPEPKPLYVGARRPVKAGRRSVNDVDGIGNPTPVGERQGGAQICRVKRRRPQLCCRPEWAPQDADPQEHCCGFQIIKTIGWQHSRFGVIAANARLIPVSGKKNAGFSMLSKFSPNARRRRLSMSHMAALQIAHGGFVSRGRLFLHACLERAAPDA